MISQGSTTRTQLVTTTVRYSSQICRHLKACADSPQEKTSQCLSKVRLLDLLIK